MTDKVRTAQRTKKLPAAAILLITIVLLVAVLWRLDRAPSTDDAYVYADTISVVPEVSGRIVELPVRDNQAVRRGDLLLRIDHDRIRLHWIRREPGSTRSSARSS